jgi:hypothetical protein
MFKSLEKKIHNYYFKHKQWLELETMYEDDGKLTEQTVCLIEKGANHCIFCTRIRTFKDLAPSELGHQPYLKVDGTEFTVTIPTFTYLTKADLANAIYYLVRENGWFVFNAKIDGWSIGEFINKKRKLYKLDPDEIGRFAIIEKENGNLFFN